jgi:hypothetical protein
VLVGILDPFSDDRQSQAPAVPGWPRAVPVPGCSGVVAAANDPYSWLSSTRRARPKNDFFNAAGRRGQQGRKESSHECRWAAAQFDVDPGSRCFRGELEDQAAAGPKTFESWVATVTRRRCRSHS